MPKVVTYDQHNLQSACNKLAEIVHASGFNYDILVAIASGGVFVARCFTDAPFYIVEQRRKSTGLKTGRLKSLLRRLPRRVNNLLRIAESRLSALKARIRPPRPANALLPDDLMAYLDANPTARVLIIDDAVDSGATLASVMASIERQAPAATVEAAAITVTRSHPIANPRFALYRDNTLIRFPWSNDA